MDWSTTPPIPIVKPGWTTDPTLPPRTSSQEWAVLLTLGPVNLARMHTGDPGAAGTANGSSVTTRYACAWSAASGGSIAMSNTPEHTLGASETITGVSFWDASTSGNFLYSAQASVSKGGVSGDIIRISSNSIGFTPLAS